MEPTDPIKTSDAAKILATMSTPPESQNRKAKRVSTGSKKFKLRDIKHTNDDTILTTYSYGKVTFTVPVYKSDTDMDFEKRRKDSAKRALCFTPQ